MTLPTHAILGLVIGKFTGNIPLAISVSILIDTDHLISYAKHKVLWPPKKFLEVVKDINDPWEDQRGYLHNVVIATIISFLVWIIFGRIIGAVFSLSYLGHLFLDAIDTANYYPFYPIKTIKIKGVIPYWSKSELFLDAIFVSIFFIK